MSLDCKVIEDLLPLYLENMCSEQSKRIVEEHLAECENCHQLVESTGAVQIPHIEPKTPAADNAVKKSFRKIRMRWLASVIAILMIVPILLLGWNQYQGRGVHFSNIHELRLSKAFMKCLCAGDYEKAYTYIDTDGLREEWLTHWFDEEKLTNMYSDGLVKFCEYGEKVEEKGGFSDYKYMGISLYGYKEDGTAVYVVLFKTHCAGKETMLDITVSDDGIEYFSGGGSFLTDPLAQFSIWSEYLWQEYEGCYFDPELKEYVYPAE